MKYIRKNTHRICFPITKATAPAVPSPINAISAPNPGAVVAEGVGAVAGAPVGNEAGAVVELEAGAVAGVPASMLNVVVVVTSASIASTFTMYSSALNVDASTSSAHSL